MHSSGMKSGVNLLSAGLGHEKVLLNDGSYHLTMFNSRIMEWGYVVQDVDSGRDGRWISESSGIVRAWEFV